jgi:uncharacterized damage-inducible protein DinB
MYRKTDDFIKNWGYESESTLKVFNAITNESLNKSFDGEVRKIGRLAWHITITIGEILGKAGLQVDCAEEHSPVPNTIEEIIKAYQEASASLLVNVKKQWSDADLLTEVSMYGENWTKGTVLNILITHQAHHRGQLGILMRLCGLKVPGVYGPSKEEWAAWNMPAAE